MRTAPRSYYREADRQPDQRGVTTVAGDPYAIGYISLGSSTTPSRL
ncbi:MAG: hypothetical protein ACLVL7_07835 [Anaerotruncus massiliensis (ex Togo et al. 2019)]